MYEEKPHVPTYDDLKNENQRLRREITTLRNSNPQHRNGSQPTGSPRAADNDMDALETQLWANLTAAASKSRSPVSNWDDIILPSRACSTALVAYDKTWNSWVHYAIQYPQFEEECAQFTDNMDEGYAVKQSDPLWLAVYFAILSVSPGTERSLVNILMKHFRQPCS